jgi:D-galactose 1-dehydrogenase
MLIDEPIFPCEATLYVPANCQAPIAAAVVLRTDSGIEIGLELDFRHAGMQTWNIDIDTVDGQLRLASGGSELSVDQVQMIADEGKLASEYAAIYRRFAELVAHKCSEVDARPMQLLADIFLIAERVAVEPFAM